MKSPTKLSTKIILGLGILFLIGLMMPEPSAQRGQVASLSKTNGVQDSACQHPTISPSGHFDASDLSAIAKTSSGNEARFDRDYKARTFYDCLHFESLERAIFGPGWDLRMKSTPKKWLADISCNIGDAAARSLVDVNEGEVLRVQGVIATTSVGTVILENCQVS